MIWRFLHARQKPSPARGAPPEGAAPAVTHWHGRSVVDAGQLLEDARKAIEGKGAPQAESLHPFPGRAAIFTGAIDDVDLGDGKTNLIFKKDFGPFEIALVFAAFEPRWRHQLEQLSTGQVVTVIGHVDQIQFSKLDLKDCELLAPGERPHEEVPAAPQARPRVLICSSSRQSSIADMLREELAPVADCALWHQGALGLPGETLEDLITGIKETHFAVLVVAPEDVAAAGGTGKASGRDDLLFLLGLFRGALARGRTFILHRQGEALDLPSELAGVTVATLSSHDGKDLRAALAPAVGPLKDALRQAGTAGLPGHP